MWQENLFQNLLVIFILTTLAAIVYIKITGKTLGDLIREIREGFTTEVE